MPEVAYDATPIRTQIVSYPARNCNPGIFIPIFKGDDIMPGTKRKGKGDAWYFEVTITDRSGAAKRFNKTFHGTAKQAEKELAVFYADCEAGRTLKGTSMTVEDLCRTYRSEYAERYLKKSALRGIDTGINTILPILGKKKINKVSRLDVQKLINALADKGLSPKTIRNYYSVLSGIMEFGVKLNELNDTPCQHITIPKKKSTEAEYYDHQEVSALLAALDTVPATELHFKVCIYIMLFGGLRKSEMLGLNWDDIDFDEKRVRICRTRQIAPKVGVYEDTPKTLKSNRTVSLPAEIFDMLNQLKAQQLERKLQLQNKYKNSPAVIQNSYGDCLYPNALYKWYVNFCHKNNVRCVGLHGLRHTHASMLANMGTDKMQLSRRLGHSQLSTTMNIYTHLFEDTDKTIADDLSKVYMKTK